MAKQELNSVEIGHEVTDMRVKVVTVFIGVIGLVTAFTIVLIIVLLRGFSAHSAKTAVPGSPLDTINAQVPDESLPRLQQDPVAERKRIVAEAQTSLNSYTLVKESGVDDGADQVHIPIARAIELVGSGQVPYRQEPKTAALEEAAQ